MSEGSGSMLLALIDGVALPEEEGKALWREFSAHMDEHRGDMGGFAKKKGWVSVSPEHRGGKAVLLVRTTAVPPEPGPMLKEPPQGRKPAKPTRAKRRKR